VTGSDNASSALVDGGAKSLKLQLQECTDNSFGSCATNVYHSGGNPTTPAVTDQAVKSNVAAGGAAYLKLFLELPGTVSDDGSGTTVQGKSATLTFTWKAAQNSAGAAR
ncbi:MAG: hypothetical protein HY332_07460, partial [Chloroflexi bacterium]|nr:hypothetical protein [Chloroflexota bacterium]